MVTRSGEVAARDVGAARLARRWWALAAISVSALVVGLDLTVLTLALPTIGATTGASTGDLQWITDSYALVMAALILPAGLLGDAYGRKRVLLVSLVVFAAASAWVAYSAGIGELIAARAVLGVGAAAVFPMAIAVIPVMFAEHERQKAVSAMAAAIFVSYPIGPILGGFLLDHFWWGSVFLINVPVVAIALVAVARWLPESRAASRPRLDVPGVTASSAALIGVTYGFIRAGEAGWTDALALSTMAAGVVLLAVFVWWERRVASCASRGDDPPKPPRGKTGSQPLVDLPLFRVTGFRWGTILMTLVTFAMFGLMFTVPLYFQDIRGATPLGSGVRMLPLVGGMLVGMAAGSRLTDTRKGPGGSVLPPLVSARLGITAGFCVMAAGLALGAFTSLSSSMGFAALWITLTGAGLGAAMPAAMNAAIGALTEDRSASGGALIQAVRQVGATIGVAVLGTVISNGYASRLPSSVTALPAAAADAVRSGVAGGVAVAGKLGSAPLLGQVRSAFVGGMDVMLWTCGGIAIASALLALIFLRQSDT
jgi:MFS transporter, DHA2 family, multidrug resistance protein